MSTEELLAAREEYKYGFRTEIESDLFPKGLDEGTVRALSAKKEEPSFMLEFRLKAFRKWKEMTAPNWGHLNIDPIDFQNIRYYAAPKKKQELSSLDEVDPEILAPLKN